MVAPARAKWPVPSDYAEVLQHPGLCFQDLLLKASQPKCNANGLPHIITGNYAGVCEIRNGTQRWAVRCFLREVSDQQRRYNIINQHLKVLRLPSLAGFEYLPQGIRVRGQWYPIVKMEWVEGESLHTFVERHLHNPHALLNLAAQWRVVVNSLHANRLAHGDLQHDNVRVTPQGQIRLVDYDAMFVPALRGELSPEIGHANFQHPKRTRNDYNEKLDNFAALVIYTSLLALAAHPSLWQQFHKGENLIFSANDYKAPRQSAVLQRLKRSTNAEVHKLADQMERCCAGSVTQTPKLEEVVAALSVQQGSVSHTATQKPERELRQELKRFYEKHQSTIWTILDPFYIFGPPDERR